MWNEEVKLSFFTDSIILSLKDPPESPKKFLDLIKINIQISVIILYSNSEQAEKEIRKTIPFTELIS
jgi:hypothetical protein